MADYQVQLNILIKNKQYMEIRLFKKIVQYICKNIASYKLLDLVLKYLQNCPQQISLIPKSNV